MTLVDFQMEGCPLCLHHVYQGEYVILDYIDLTEGSGRFVTILFMRLEGGGGGKSEKLEKFVGSTVYGIIELEDD